MVICFSSQQTWRRFRTRCALCGPRRNCCASLVTPSASLRNSGPTPHRGPRSLATRTLHTLSRSIPTSIRKVDCRWWGTEAIQALQLHVGHMALALASESELGPRVTTGKCRIVWLLQRKSGHRCCYQNYAAGRGRRAEWGALTWNKDNMVNAATAFPVSCFTSGAVCVLSLQLLVFVYSMFYTLRGSISNGLKGLPGWCFWHVFGRYV